MKNALGILNGEETVHDPDPPPVENQTENQTKKQPQQRGGREGLWASAPSAAATWRRAGSGTGATPRLTL